MYGGEGGGTVDVVDEATATSAVSDNDTASTCCVGEQDNNKKENIFQFMNRISTKVYRKGPTNNGWP